MDANGLTTAYVGLDAISVRQQGPHAEPVEGRMPLMAIVFGDDAMTTKPALRGARYVAGLVDWLAIGQQLRRECLTEALAGIVKHLFFILDF